jgi:hypothetical protein
MKSFFSFVRSTPTRKPSADGVISISSVDKQEETSLSASFNAEYNGLLAGGSFSSSVNSSKNFQSGELHIQVTTYQRGGIGGTMSFTGLQVSDMIQRMKDFAGIVTNQSGAAVPYHVLVASYKTLALPEVNFVEIEQQRFVLQDYARRRLDLITALNDIHYIRRHPDYYVNPPDIKTLNAWSQTLTDQLNHLVQNAARCAENMSECAALSIQYPDNFAMPQRKAGAAPPPPPQGGPDLIIDKIFIHKWAVKAGEASTTARFRGG